MVNKGMKNNLIFVFVSLLAFGLLVPILLSNSSAQSTSSVDKAYTCLQNQISSRSTLTLQESLFAVMALGNYKSILNNLSEQKSSDNCWPKTGCKIKETAQGLLAYNRVGSSTLGIETWLLARNGTTTDLSWYLEIDTESHESSACTVKYSGGQASINIGSDMKLSGSAGSCFSISSSGYLLRIRDSCLDKEFQVSCDKGFISSLLYQKNKGENIDCLDQGNTTCYVLGETHGAPSLGSTSERIKASCFKLSGVCDYEGSLWATLALQQAGRNIDSYTPYLIALAEDYERYFPYSFLSNILGGSDELSYSKVLELRKQNQYWEMSASPYNRFYDTALGMLALGSGSTQDEISKTQTYLQNIQTKEGCWNNNNIRDTAILLYSGWKKTTSGGTGGTGTSTGSSSGCKNAGYFCEKLSDCISSNGTSLAGYSCDGVSMCCSVQVPKPTCNSQNGIICPAQTECSGSIFVASDTQGCCLGTCSPITNSNECEQSGGLCASSCTSSETQTSSQCSSFSQFCCVPTSSSSSSLWWIIILVVLIILIVIAILIRHRIQMWWFSRKSGTSVKPVTRGPPMPPSSSYRPNFPQRPMNRQMPPQIQARPSQSLSSRPLPPKGKPGVSKDYEDTLKKLKEMSK
ncbi:MAG: hypothetical protein AABX66_04135 [Nanoarchaeota archaeon]